MSFLWLYIIVAIVVIFILTTSSAKVLREYERAVVFTLGRFQDVRGPGLVFLIPFVQHLVRVDLRIQVIEIPSQDVISRDNISMKVDAVVYFRVAGPERAVIQIQSYLPATNMLAQTTLRSVLGQHELDEMLSERKKLSADIQSILDAETELWGIKVSNVEIRTVELTENMVRAIAKQAEAERDRRAKIIHADAELRHAPDPFESRRMRERDLADALSLHHVHVVHAGRLHIDPHLPRPGSRTLSRRLHDKLLRTTECPHNHSSNCGRPAILFPSNNAPARGIM